MRSQAQYTIYSLTDVYTGTTAPTNPYKGQLWVDTSQTPPITKVYTGSAWKEQNDTDDIRSNITTLTTKQATFETNLSGLSSSVSSITTRVDSAEDDIADLQSDVSTAISDISTLQQTASEISAEVSNKVDTTCGTSSSSFGWSLTSSGFYIYSNATEVVKITTSGLEVNGKITSTSGTIGGFTINSTNLHTGSKTSYSSSTSGIYIGTNGIGLGTGKFYVTSAGYLYTVYGKIGGFTISTYYLVSGTIGAANSVCLATGTTTSVSIAGSSSLTTWAVTAGANFGVTRAGALYCSDVYVTGEVNATSGYFENCEISDSCTIYGWVYLSGNEEVKYYGVKTQISYETWVGGTGIASQCNVTPKNKSTHVSYTYNRPFGQILVPENYLNGADDGMIFGIMQSNSYKTQSLLCGASYYHQSDDSGYTDEHLLRAGDKPFLDATLDPTNGYRMFIGFGSGKNVFNGEFYVNEESDSYLSSKVLGTTTLTFYGCLYGRWYINNQLYFGTSTIGYLSTSTQNSTVYPMLAGTWYGSTIYFGSYTSYHTRIDGDQVTFYYGTTELGELESYSTGYVDVQGTFKTNGSNWISSSDRKVKNSIEDYDDRYSILFDNLRPRRFKFNKGNSNRYHTGFIVQETIEALDIAGIDRSEFASVCAFGDADDPRTMWGLRYEELISLNTWEIQKLKRRVLELENKIINLGGTI